MNVNHFVIHHIQKTKHGEPRVQTKKSEATLHEEDGNLSAQGKLIQDFVEDASGMFDRQRSGKVYADVGRDGKTFAEWLDRYLKGEYSFIEFTTRMAKELNNQMKGVQLATGGYMAVADYTASPRKLLILMIRQEEGFAVDPKTLELRQSIHLDLSTINVGARIDLDGYQNGDERHLAMVRGLKEIATYFRDFLGVVNYKSPKDETEELKTVLDAYLHQNRNRIDQASAADIKRKVAVHITENKDSDTSLLAIAGIVNPTDPQEFHDYANNHGVSAEIRGEPSAVKGWLRVRYTNRRMTLDFDKSLLTEEIQYEPDMGQLLVMVSAFPGLAEKLEEAQK
jgi:nucleoid-associated protein